MADLFWLVKPYILNMYSVIIKICKLILNRLKACCSLDRNHLFCSITLFPKFVLYQGREYHLLGSSSIAVLQE